MPLSVFSRRSVFRGFARNPVTGPALVGFDDWTTHGIDGSEVPATEEGFQLTDDDAASVHYIDKLFTVPATSANVYTLSVEARRHGADNRDLLISFESPAGQPHYAEACWNLSNGSKRSSNEVGQYTSHDSSIGADLGGGWRRYALRATKGNAAAAVQGKIFLSTVAGQVVYGPGDMSSIEIRNPAFGAGDTL